MLCSLSGYNSFSLCNLMEQIRKQWCSHNEINMANPSIRHTRRKDPRHLQGNSKQQGITVSQHGYHQHFKIETLPSLPVGGRMGSISSTSMLKSQRFSLNWCLGPHIRISSSSSSKSSSVIRWVLGISQRKPRPPWHSMQETKALPQSFHREPLANDGKIVDELAIFWSSHYLFWVPMATFEGFTPLTVSAELHTAPVGQASEMLPDLVRLKWHSANAAFELRWRNLMFLQHLLHIFSFGFVESLRKAESRICFLLTRHGGSNIRTGCNVWMSTCKILHG